MSLLEKNAAQLGGDQHDKWPAVILKSENHEPLAPLRSEVGGYLQVGLEFGTLHPWFLMIKKVSSKFEFVNSLILKELW